MEKEKVKEIKKFLIKKKKSISIIGATVLVLAGILFLLPSKNKEKKTFEEVCSLSKVPISFLQPPQIKSGVNRIPLTAFSYLENDRFGKAFNDFEREKPLNSCEIYKIIKYENFYQYYPKENNVLKTFIKKKNEEAVKQRNEFILRVKKLEDDSGLELTDFEERLLGEIYLINKYNFKVVRNGSYTFTTENTPEKLNFFLKELGVYKGIEFINFYHLENGKATQVDLKNIIFYNILPEIPNKNYQFVFKKYGIYIYQDLIDKQNAENAKLAEEQKKKQEEELKKQLEKQVLQQQEETQPTRITETPTISPEQLNISNSSDSSKNTSNASIPKQKLQEIPLPEKPKYIPKKIEKPKSGGISTFEKKERTNEEQSVIEKEGE